MSPDPEETPPVRQRNTTGSAFTFTSHPPVRVEVGEVYEHPVLLDGWTAVDDEPEPTPDPAPEPEQAADEPQPKTKSRRVAAADTEKGGEPR
ncbi:hypothetical protein ACFXKC_40870 [Streptomyces sp. NPDC059340]|uniref:hypothetical protein n=1 Tax=Streptomyces sp. NPDC059340 TaxID=3346806 RepID=UPI0036B8ABFE